MIIIINEMETIGTFYIVGSFLYHAPTLPQPGMVLMSLTILEMEIGLSATSGMAMLPENSDGDRVLSQLSAVSDPRFLSCVAVGPCIAIMANSNIY